jgi:hypothetical protein
MEILHPTMFLDASIETGAMGSREQMSCLIDLKEDSNEGNWL